MIVRSIVVAALVVLLADLPGIAQPGEAYEETVVSTEICSGLWIVPLVWSPEGREPEDLVAVFDTGATNTFIDPDAIERISGKRVAQGKRAKMEDLSVAGWPFKKFKAEVRDLDHLSRALGRRLDIFLPFPTFDNFLLILDYPALEMRIRRGELPRPNGKMVFDARGRDDRPWLKVKVGRIDRYLLVDSGSSGSITLRPHKKLDWVSDPIPLKVFQGMYDVELMEVGRLDGQAQVGPLTFDRPLVALTDGTELLGALVLKNYVLTFDQKNRRLLMESSVPGPVSTEPHRGTGAIFRQRVDHIEINQVIAGSPADEAGLRRGDQVTHVDGVHILDRGCRDFYPEVSESTTLTIVRGEEAFEVTIENVVLVP